MTGDNRQLEALALICMLGKLHQDFLREEERMT